MTITTEIEPGCPPVLGDAKQLAIVLDNLLNNALEAMPAGGTLTVSCRPEGGAVRLRVADTGTGIPASVAGALFTPFVSTKPDGTGIGLAICRRIVEAHGGAIAFETSDGRGTRFDVRLPVAPAPSPDESSAPDAG